MWAPHTNFMLLHLHWFTNAVLLRCSFISTTKGTDYKISTFFSVAETIWHGYIWLSLHPFKCFANLHGWVNFKDSFDLPIYTNKKKNTLEVQKNWTRSASEQESSEQLFFFFLRVNCAENSLNCRTALSISKREGEFAATLQKLAVFVRRAV